MTSETSAPRVVMITGASRGIGLAIAEGFYHDGASLSLGVRNPASLDGHFDSSRCLVFAVDVTDYEKLERFAQATVARFGTIDVLVNNAGVDEPVPLAAITVEHLERVMATNFHSAVLLTRHVAAVMSENGGGSVINISSIAGKEGVPHHIAYTASKHALLAFTKCAARELIGHSIRVNAVCPGLINTRMLENFFAEYSAQIGSTAAAELQRMIDKTPRRVMGEGEDVAELVSFLASPRARNIVGQAINTDGGLLQW
jgi:NAD(P)-dependent dehydrogenase (short-subunit alcohol dehydrogenase family)